MADKKLRYTSMGKGFFIDEQSSGEVVDLKTIEKRGHDPKVTTLSIGAKLISVSKPKAGTTKGTTGGSLSKDKKDLEELKKKLAALKASLKK